MNEREVDEGITERIGLGELVAEMKR